MDMPLVQEQLKARLRVGGQVLFRVVQRKNEPVVLRAVDVSQHEG